MRANSWLRNPLSAAFAAAAFSAALSLAPTADAALKEGSQAPDFTTTAALGGASFTFKLSEALKKGPVVLYFFPAAFTSGCTVEAHEFAEATADFTKLGATVIGVTAGNVERVAEFSKVECRDKFAVAADPGAKIAAQYQSTLIMRPGWSDRTSYVIAPSGKILLTYSDLSPNKHVEKTLAAVQAGKSGAK